MRRRALMAGCGFIELLEGETMVRTALVLMAAIVLALGCGVSVDSFPDNAGKTYCKRVYECCSAMETADAGAYGPDQPSCEKNVAQNFSSKTGLIKSEQQKGRLTYHADRAQACLDKLAALKCQELKVAATATPTECTTYLEAKTALGAPCQLTESCIGAWCSGASVTADGTCTSFVPEGQNCDAGTCATGTYCGGADRTCVKPKADGAECRANFECATGGCNDKNPDGGVGTCGLKGGAGSTCFIAPGCSATGPGVFALLALALFLRRR
jgi:hypothetical protein